MDFYDAGDPAKFRQAARDSGSDEFCNQRLYGLCFRNLLFILLLRCLFHATPFMTDLWNP